MGYAGLKQLGLSQLQSLTIAVIVGLVFMFLSAFLMFSIKKLEKYTILFNVLFTIFALIVPFIFISIILIKNEYSYIA